MIEKKNKTRIVKIKYIQEQDRISFVWEGNNLDDEENLLGLTFMLTSGQLTKVTATACQLVCNSPTVLWMAFLKEDRVDHFLPCLLL